MRRFFIAIGLLLVAAVATGAAMLTTSGLPLAWRGALTRRVYGEVARSRLPALRCTPVHDSVTVPRGVSGSAGPRDTVFLPALSRAEGRLRCAGGAAESGARTRLELEDGWVTSMAREWWVPAARGAALADSLSQVVSRERGAAVRCRTPQYSTGDAQEMFLYWGPREGAPFIVELHAWSVTWRQRSDGTVMRVPREWYVAIHQHHEKSLCQPA